MKERDLIDRIVAAAQDGSAADVLQSIGDDCAVIARDADSVWLLTMDTLVESVHFNCSWHPADRLARKAVSVNVSDVAAMGGRPRFVLLSLGLPAGSEQAWISRFVKGFTAGCSRYGCLLVGGDTVLCPAGISLTVTVIGEAAAADVIYRHGARVGDTVWVSGPLGLAAAGLDLFKAGLTTGEQLFEPLLNAHLDPRARPGLGLMLAASGLVHAMVDLSDGLATDLAHLCSQSGVGARIRAKRLPRHEGLVRAGRLLGHDPVHWIISGGEDYELLFTADPDDTPQLRKLVVDAGREIYPVGRIVAGTGVVLITGTADDGREEEQVISYQGYEHFVAGTGKS